MISNEKIEVVFNGLGPNGTYVILGKKYTDGDVVSVSSEKCRHLFEIGFAVPTSQVSADAVKALVVEADKKRKELVEKLQTRKEKSQPAKAE